MARQFDYFYQEEMQRCQYKFKTRTIVDRANNMKNIEFRRGFRMSRSTYRSIFIRLILLSLPCIQVDIAKYFLYPILESAMSIF